jgi:hypothetical protein
MYIVEILSIEKIMPNALAFLNEHAWTFTEWITYHLELPCWMKVCPIDWRPGVNHIRLSFFVIEWDRLSALASLLSVILECKARGQYYKTLQIDNLKKMYRFYCKLVFCYCQSLSQDWANTLAYYVIRTLRICNVL